MKKAATPGRLLLLALLLCLPAGEVSPSALADRGPSVGEAPPMTAGSAGARLPQDGEIDWDAAGDEAVEILQRYLRIDTTNPPGRVVESADLLRGILEAEGIEVRWLESDAGVAGNLLARLPATGEPAGKPILLQHHMDVVPADPARWARDPFGGEIVDGQIWGRGAMDMKGLGVIHLMTLLQLARQQVPLSRDVLLLAVADEETGGQRGLNWMVDNHPDLVDVAWVLDEGGFGARDVLADDRLVFNVSVAEKQIVWLRLHAEGIAGHGSQPHDANPNDHLVRALGRILELPDLGEPPPVVTEMRRRVGELADNKFTHAITGSTLSLTSLRSGVGDPPKVNVIPSLARATLDVRLLPGVPVEDFLRRLRDAAGETVRVETTYVMDEAPVTSWDTELFRIIERTVRRHHPDAVVTPSPIPYGTDANTLRARGVGAYGFTPMVVSLDVVSSMHGDAERIPVTELRRGVRIFYEIVREFAGRDSGSG